MKTLRPTDGAGRGLSPTALFSVMMPTFDLAPHRDASLRHRRRMLAGALMTGAALGLLSGVLVQWLPEKQTPSSAPPPGATANHVDDRAILDEADQLRARIAVVDAARSAQALQIERLRRLPTLLRALQSAAGAARNLEAIGHSRVLSHSGDDIPARADLAADEAAPRIGISALRWREGVADLECRVSPNAVSQALASLHQPTRTSHAGNDEASRPIVAEQRLAMPGRAAYATAIDGWLARVRAAMPEAVVETSALRFNTRDRVATVDFAVKVTDAESVGALDG